MRIKILLALFLSTFIFSFNSNAEEKNETSSKPSLNYYYFDGWVLCSKITVIVNDLKKKHDKKIDIVLDKKNIFLPSKKKDITQQIKDIIDSKNKLVQL